MCRVTRGEALFRRILMARTRRSRFATRDRFDAPLRCHATVAELSLHTPTCDHFVSVTASNTSQPRTSAAISRSELVMSPAGFSSVTRRALTSAGHSTRHTIGFNSLVPGSHTPPAPSPDASSVPTYAGSPATSSLVCVGSLKASRMSCAQSLSISATAGHLFQNICFGCQLNS